LTNIGYGHSSTGDHLILQKNILVRCSS